MVNPKALKLFHLIANKGSLAAASEQFHLSPPAASRMISLLEVDLGFNLFSRDGRNLTLTEDGHRFLRESLPILHNFESIDRIAQDIKTKSTTALRILSTAPVAVSWITPALGRLKIKYPDFACAVEIVDHLGMQTLVGSRSHDVAVASLPLGRPSSRLTEHPLCEFAFEAIFHKTHPLAAQKSVSAADIAQFPIIGLYQGQIGRTRQDEFFRSQNINIVPQIETSSSIVALSLCQQNFGIALMPSVYMMSNQYPNLTSRPTNPIRNISFGAVTAEGQKLSSFQMEFLTELKTIADDWQTMSAAH
ncbi:MAG: hypothetical protein COB24_06010 [Hyphomicrobiales bacterium]|nr:MAG: hypothetical protein COB24_06010 [Hyphomicrobiales bacterium]